MDATLILYVKCIAAIGIGLVIHTLVKFNEASDLYKKGNVGELTLFSFLKLRPFTHILNIVCAAAWLLFLPDGIKAFPEIKGSVFLANVVHIALCLIVGYANSSIILKMLGSGTKYAMDVIDKKTNIADGK